MMSKLLYIGRVERVRVVLPNPLTVDGDCLGGPAVHREVDLKRCKCDPTQQWVRRVPAEFQPGNLRRGYMLTSPLRPERTFRIHRANMCGPRPRWVAPPPNRSQHRIPSTDQPQSARSPSRTLLTARVGGVELRKAREKKWVKIMSKLPHPEVDVS